MVSVSLRGQAARSFGSAGSLVVRGLACGSGGARPRFLNGKVIWIAAAALGLPAIAANGQTNLPEIRVTTPSKRAAAHKTPAPKRATTRETSAPKRAGARKPAPVSRAAGPAAPDLAAKTRAFDAARDNILPKIGTNTYEFGREAIEALPAGSNTPVGTVLQQAPGVNQDTAASFEGPIHVRLEHGFTQYRINGILLPDGATGFTQLLETGFISNLALVTGALPAQYGFRTAGLVDITTRSGSTPGGDIGIYGGSRGTITPFFGYGGTVGATEYFMAGRYFQSDVGIENPTPALRAIHDRTEQGKFFGYASTLLDDSTRLVFITGSAVSQFQIPNRPGQVPPPDSLLVPGVAGFDSSQLNERQVERNFYNVMAWQKKVEDIDLQLSYFSRYSNVHFTPDPAGDLFFNNVAVDVLRTSLLNGVAGDGAFRLNDSHTLRAGFSVSAEQTQNANSSLVLATGGGGACGPAAECLIVDDHAKLGRLFGTYVQDEWRITDRLTLNAGLRFDQMWEFVAANQFSPRVGLVYKPFDDTTFHAGYARYFTPASQLLSASPNLALYTNTTLQPATAQADPVLPERADYFDVGVVQKIRPGLEAGVAAYYKLARDQIDVGQFGPALVLNEFNYEKGFNRGIELKVKYEEGNFRAYGNLAWAQQFATNIVSQQYLFDPETFAYVATHLIYTDLSQAWTGSAGASYLWQGTRLSADMIYGSGLRSGFANTDHMAPYAQFNLGATHEFAVPGETPVTVRFTVVNVFDTVYELRNGTGIGVFAPQFGPRRGYFVGLSKKL